MKMTKMNKEKLLELYEKTQLQSQEKLDYINKQLGLNIRSVDTLRTMIKNIRKEKQGTDIEEDKKEIINNKTKKETKDKYKESLNKITQLENMLELISCVKDYKTKDIKIENNTDNWESTAFMIASDWHIEEDIDTETVDYLNEYNPDIATKRAMNFFANGLKLTNMFSKETKINNIVLWLLWDFISWYIHEELEESNHMSPIEALIKLKELLVNWIKYLLDNSKYKITVITAVWNHWRTTERMRVSTSYKNNYEWLVYHLIADEFKSNKRIEFKISKGYHNYLKVYDYMIRFHHWDSIKYGGWVWWITIPVNKAISQWNKSKRADLDVFGHFHQLTFHRDWICNGSLIWYNAYALKIKAEFEEPQQAFFLINNKYGKTIQTKIILENK